MPTKKKVAMSSYIVNRYLPENLGRGGLIIDSGPTAASVAAALSLSHATFKSLDVFTNNVLASMLLSSVKTIRCYLVPGIADEKFAGVFGPAADEAIAKVDATVTILACSSFSKTRGPHANRAENRSFKRAVIEKTKKTVVVVAGHRIGSAGGSPILESADEWNRVLAENIDIIVTSPSKEAEELRRELGRKVKIVAP